MTDTPQTPGVANKVAFAVGSGRCGTKFLATALSEEDGVSAHHERNVLAESFDRYCRWYGLPVDEEGFLHAKEHEIKEDLVTHEYSFEASAPLSFAVEPLHYRLTAKLILLTRSPEAVVKSYEAKGLFSEEFAYANTSLALGYQPRAQFHHFLGRTVPTGSAFDRWNALTQVGKIAWWWSVVNDSVLEAFTRLPSDATRIQALEDLNHATYCQLIAFLGRDSTLNSRRFNALARRKPNRIASARSVSDWSRQERTEFEAQVAETAQRLGYDYRTSRNCGWTT